MKPTNSKSRMKLSNQSLVIERFGDNEKMTISEVAAKLIIYAREIDDPSVALSERTVRRAIEELTESGFLKVFGRNLNATVYGKPPSSFRNPEGEQAMVPFHGELLTVEDFLRHVVGPDGEPLKLKVSMLSTEIENHIRRRLAFVLLSAGQPGLDDELAKTKNVLEKFIYEIEFLHKFLSGFVNSPLWYTQYRDGIGFEMRKMQQKNPELFQLTTEFVAGG